MTKDFFQRVAGMGMNLYLAGFSDGGFGYFVPTDKAFAEDVQRVTRLAQGCGLRVVPFTAPTLPAKRLPPECKKHFDDWVILRRNGAALEPLAGPTWYYFCFEPPGFISFLKEGLQRTMREFPFDGLYCDGFYPMGPCYNASHGPVPHACWEGLLDLARWMRESLLGTDKLLWAHTGYYPTFIVDNLCDVTWIFEEVNYWYNKEGRVCSLERLSEMAEIVPNTDRVLDTKPVDHWMTYPGEKIQDLHWEAQDVKEYMTRIALCGLFSTALGSRIGPRSAEDIFVRLSGHFRLARMFRDFDLSRFRFADWRAQAAALPDAPAVRCAVYWNNEDALVVVGNSERRERVDCRLRLSAEAFGWRDSCRWQEMPDGKYECSSLEVLARKGIPLRLDGFDYKVIHLHRAAE